MANSLDPTDSTSSIDPASLLPHAHPMVLLDSIVRWNSDAIVCSSRSHLAADNPLRVGGHLSVFAGVEYAAQAMAAHSRLLADDDAPPRKGFLAVASKVTALAQSRDQNLTQSLDQWPQTLTIEAWVMAQTRDSSMYQFRLSVEDKPLLEGQLTAVLSSG